MGGPVSATETFCDYLRYERRLSAHTVVAYRRDLERLTVFASECGINDLRHLHGAQARVFPARLHHQGLSSRTIQRTLSAARAFYRYLLREKAVKNNPFEGVVAPKGEKKLPSTLNVEQAANWSILNRRTTSITVTERYWNFSIPRVCACLNLLVSTLPTWTSLAGPCR